MLKREKIWHTPVVHHRHLNLVQLKQQEIGMGNLSCLVLLIRLLVCRFFCVVKFWGLVQIPRGNFSTTPPECQNYDLISQFVVPKVSIAPITSTLWWCACF